MAYYAAATLAAMLMSCLALPCVCMLQVGLRESLLSQDVQLYHNMKKAAPAAGHVTISPYDAMWHDFQSFFTLPEAEAANQEMGDFMRRALDRPITTWSASC